MEGGKQVGSEWDYANSPERAALLEKGNMQKVINEYKLKALIEELQKPQGPINQEIRKSDAELQ